MITRPLNCRLTLPIVLSILLISAVWFSTSAIPIISAPARLPELKVHFINVGQGDSILIDLGTTEILIDGGDASPSVVTYLTGQVDGNLEAMVATHPHADHIGGLTAVLTNFVVDNIWLNGDASTSQTYNTFMSAVNAEGASVHIAQRGGQLSAGSLILNVLNPVQPLVDSTNNRSIILLLNYGNIDFLFMGDAEQAAEAGMVSAGLISDVEVLKVGHHGSKTASSIQFLQAAQPDVAIYMAGAGNQYGHPHQETINALAQIQSKIYGTDIHGTTVITTDGTTFNVQPTNNVPPLIPVNISVVLQGGTVRPNPTGWTVPMMVKLFTPGANVITGAPVYTFNLTTAVSGTDPDLRAVCQARGVNVGNYDITVVTPHTLINIKRNVAIGAPSTAIFMGTLLEGDANDNRIVNIQDFGIMAVSYGKTAGTAGYDARADFNRNNIVNIQDFGMLAINFSKTAPVEVP